MISLLCICSIAYTEGITVYHKYSRCFVAIYSGADECIDPQYWVTTDHPMMRAFDSVQFMGLSCVYGKEEATVKAFVSRIQNRIKTLHTLWILVKQKPGSQKSKAVESAWMKLQKDLMSSGQVVTCKLIL